MNSRLPEVVIYTDRYKTLGYFLLCVIFALGGLWLISEGDIALLPGFILCCFFLPGSIFHGYRWFVPAPAVIINERSLGDNTSLIAIGTISWDEIETIYLSHLYIFIRVFDSRRIISRQPLLKKLMLILLRIGSSAAPFAMSLHCTKGTPEEVYQQIYAYFIQAKIFF
jgi:hypothetical protein